MAMGIQYSNQNNWKKNLFDYYTVVLYNRQTKCYVSVVTHLIIAGQHTILNRDQGTAIADCWKSLLKHTTSRSRHNPTSNSVSLSDITCINSHMLFTQTNVPFSFVCRICSDENNSIHVAVVTLAFQLMCFVWNTTCSHNRWNNQVRKQYILYGPNFCLTDSRLLQTAVEVSNLYCNYM